MYLKAVYCSTRTLQHLYFKPGYLGGIERRVLNVSSVGMIRQVCWGVSSSWGGPTPPTLWDSCTMWSWQVRHTGPSRLTGESSDYTCSCSPFTHTHTHTCMYAHTHTHTHTHTQHHCWWSLYLLFWRLSGYCRHWNLPPCWTKWGNKPVEWAARSHLSGRGGECSREDWKSHPVVVLHKDFVAKQKCIDLHAHSHGVHTHTFTHTHIHTRTHMYTHTVYVWLQQSELSTQCGFHYQWTDHGAHWKWICAQGGQNLTQNSF